MLLFRAKYIIVTTLGLTGYCAYYVVCDIWTIWSLISLNFYRFLTNRATQFCLPPNYKKPSAKNAFLSINLDWALSGSTSVNLSSQALSKIPVFKEEGEGGESIALMLARGPSSEKLCYPSLPFLR